MSDSEFSWATVYSTSPVTVRKDGETEPIGVTPQTVVPLSMLKTDDRVWCQFVKRRALILGRAGGAWPIMASGYVTITSEANKITKTTVTFPSGRFSKEPRVFVTAKTSVPGSTVQEVSYQNASKSSVDIFQYRTSSTNTGVSWLAVEF